MIIGLLISPSERTVSLIKRQKEVIILDVHAVVTLGHYLPVQSTNTFCFC